MNKITTDWGTWELFNNNDGNWMALPIGSVNAPTFEGSTIGSVSFQVHNWEPKEQPKEQPPFVLSPCEQLGWKEGDKFKIKEGRWRDWMSAYIIQGEDVSLCEDDGTPTPYFRGLKSGGKIALSIYTDVDPISTVEAPVKSTGGSSSYYRFPIKSSITGQTMEVETGDVIKAMVDNDFDLGNILKACRRISQAKQGKGKAGTDVAYDCNKIIYFAEQIKKEWEGE